MGFFSLVEDMAAMSQARWRFEELLLKFVIFQVALLVNDGIMMVQDNNTIFVQS